MIKKSVILLFCIAISFITGCTNNNNEASDAARISSNKLTIEDINKIYSIDEIKNIINYRSDYVLVESSEGEQ